MGRAQAKLEAPNGAAGLAFAAHADRPIDLLVTDAVMPEMGGRELAERLRAVDPGVRVLFVSGFSGGGSGRRNTIPDDVAFLAKPFSGDALLRAVRRALDAPA